MARRARRLVRGEVGLGARELLRVQCGARRRLAAPARVGGRAMVAGRRRRASGAARDRRAVRRVVVRQDRGAGPRRRRLPRAAVRQPRRARAGEGHLHADAQLPRRHRVRLHRHPPGGRSLLDRHGDGVRQPRPRVDAPSPPRRRERRRGRHDGAVVVLRPLGSAARATSCAVHAGLAGVGRLPVHVRSRHHGGRRARAGAARHLRRRAGLGALLPHRVRDDAVAASVGGR